MCTKPCQRGRGEQGPACTDTYSHVSVASSWRLPNLVTKCMVMTTKKLFSHTIPVPDLLVYLHLPCCQTAPASVHSREIWAVIPSASADEKECFRDRGQQNQQYMRQHTLGCFYHLESWEKGESATDTVRGFHPYSRKSNLQHFTLIYRRQPRLSPDQQQGCNTISCTVIN